MTLASDYNAANYLLGLVRPGCTPKDFLATYRLRESDERSLAIACSSDASRFAYNGAASVLSGLHSLVSRGGVWTATQMYYAVFYLSRAALSRNGCVVFHAPRPSGDGHTQFELTARCGETPVVSKVPSTHKLVADLFRRLGYPPFMRSLRIANQDPLEWITQQREHWQYRCGRFPDPELPAVLAGINPNRLTQLVEAYFSDSVGVYLADEKHALLSMPLRLLKWTLESSSLSSSAVLVEEDLQHLKARCRIGKQHMTGIERLLLK